VTDHAHTIHELPIVVLFPHNRCNCRCVMCDIWRIREVRQILPDDLRPHLESFRALRVQQVVFSGGEAQLNPDLRILAAMLRAEGIHLTLLTSGLLLKTRAAEVAETIDELIVSLDGPPAVHDRIRNVPSAFDRLQSGVDAVRALRSDMKISARTTVQKANYGVMRATVETAKGLGLNGISFLAADTTSGAFNRTQPWAEGRQSEIALACPEIEELEREVKQLIRDYHEEIRTGYIAENATKLARIVQHFRASSGDFEAVAPRCNAPWVSAVIEADGSVRPCFFHEAFGNIHQAPLLSIINSDQALRFRERLDISSNPVCRNCVCSLYRPLESVTGQRPVSKNIAACDAPPEPQPAACR
jgi:Fe-coproporphyrin III synthase